MSERTEEEVEWLNRIRTMEKLDRELFTKKETFYAIKYESEKEIRDISKMVKDRGIDRIEAIFRIDIIHSEYIYGS